MLRPQRRVAIRGLFRLLAIFSVTGCITSGQRSGVVYQVKVENGDTLAGLSRQFDTDWKTIARMNGLSARNPLRIGQVLRIAAGPSAANLQPDPVESAGRRQGRVVAVKPRPGRDDERPIEQPASPDAGEISGDEKTWQEEDLNAPRKTPGANHDDSGDFGAGRAGRGAGLGRGFMGEPAQNFVVRWPAVGEVSSNYGPRWGRFHNGIDIRANRGTKIVAAAEGRVIFVGRLNGYGKTVIIDHGQYRSLYGHCGKIVAKQGTWVRAGEHIAHVGISGNSRGAHLHFELRTRRDQPVDPIPFMEAKLLSSKGSNKARRRGAAGSRQVRTAASH